MTPQQTVEAFIACWNRMDMPGAFALMHPDIVYHNIPMEPARGHAGVQAVFAGFPPMEAVDWITHAIAANGPLVLTERTDKFKINGAWLSLPVMGTFEVHDGLITAWRDYFDLQQFMGPLQAIMAKA
jgi:limonene-1,2-epoxide hydrolase